MGMIVGTCHRDAFLANLRAKTTENHDHKLGSELINFSV
jgi:hypothetical protein